MRLCSNTTCELMSLNKLLLLLLTGEGEAAGLHRVLVNAIEGK